MSDVAKICTRRHCVCEHAKEHLNNLAQILELVRETTPLPMMSDARINEVSTRLQTLAEQGHNCDRKVHDA